MIARGNLNARVADKEYEIRYCATSGLYFQSWVMDDDELAKWYSSPAGDEFFGEKIAEQKLHWFAHQAEEILVLRQICQSARPTVLDFGCNWGKWASMALAFGCDVYGVEVNRNAAAFCRKRGIQIIDQDQLDQFPFDYVNADQVLEHVSDPIGLGRRLAGCLKPSGILKVSTPGNSRLPKILRKAQHEADNAVVNAETLDSLYPLEHVNLFSNSSLKIFGEKIGLERCRAPVLTWLGAGQLWNIPRQLNRNLIVPFKRWLGKGTYLWFKKARG